MTVCPRRTLELTLVRHQGNTSLSPGSTFPPPPAMITQATLGRL